MAIGGARPKLELIGIGSSSVRNERRPVITVRDHGTGIAPEHLAQVGTPALPRALPEIPAPVNQAYPGVIRYEVVNLYIRVHWAAFAIWLAQDVAYFFAKYLLSLILVLAVVHHQF